MEKIFPRWGAYDIVADRNQTDYERISDRIVEMAFNVKLRNHKDQPVVVLVNEPIGGDWRILQSIHNYEKTAGGFFSASSASLR